MSGTDCLSHLARPLGTTAPRRRRIVSIPTTMRFQCRICARPLIGAPPSAPTAKRIPRIVPEIDPAPRGRADKLRHHLDEDALGHQRT